MGVILGGPYTEGQVLSNGNGTYKYTKGQWERISGPNTPYTPTVVNGAVTDAATNALGQGLQALPPVSEEDIKAAGEKGLTDFNSAIAGAGGNLLNSVLGALPKSSAAAPSAPAPAPPLPASTDMADFYTGAMAPPVQSDGQLVQSSPTDLTSRPVQTVPIDGSGNPVLPPQPPAPPPTGSGWDKWYTGDMAPPTSADGTLYQSGAPIPAPPVAPPAPIQTAQAVPPVADPFGTNDPNKDQSRLTGTQLPSAGDMEPPTVSRPPPLNITIPGPGTPTDVTGTMPTAVASDTDTSPLPPDSPKYTPGYMPPMITPPMVKIASGKTVPVGTLGTAQGGTRNYEVMADGSVWSGDRMTSPPTVMGPPAMDTSQPKASPAPSAAPTASSANGFMDFFNRTPAGHIVQAVTGQPVQGGLLKAIGVNSGNTGDVRMPAMPSSPNPSATYWDPRAGTWVNQ